MVSSNASASISKDKSPKEESASGSSEGTRISFLLSALIIGIVLGCGSCNCIAVCWEDSGVGSTSSCFVSNSGSNLGFASGTLKPFLLSGSITAWEEFICWRCRRIPNAGKRCDWDEGWDDRGGAVGGGCLGGYGDIGVGGVIDFGFEFGVTGPCTCAGFDLRSFSFASGTGGGGITL